MDFNGVRVLVVGDVMLDRYVSGGARRISPEAPVPVVAVGRRWSAPGGAANVARNLARLGVVADLVGLDTCLSIMDVLYRDTGDSKYRACFLLRKMVKGGLLGKKSGRGFYNYSK